MKRDQLIQVAQYFVGKTGMDDGDLVDLLHGNGLAREESERLVAFLPIAFGRVVIAHIGKVSFTTDYRVKETGKTYSLSDEPIFVEALKLAAEGYHSGLFSRESFTAVALRSPELDAVNKALNDGTDINGASFQTVEFFGYKSLGKRGWVKRFLG